MKKATKLVVAILVFTMAIITTIGAAPSDKAVSTKEIISSIAAEHAEAISGSKSASTVARGVTVEATEYATAKMMTEINLAYDKEVTDSLFSNGVISQTQKAKMQRNHAALKTTEAIEEYVIRYTVERNVLKKAVSEYGISLDLSAASEYVEQMEKLPRPNEFALTYVEYVDSIAKGLGMTYDEYKTKVIIPDKALSLAIEVFKRMVEYDNWDDYVLYLVHEAAAELDK